MRKEVESINYRSAFPAHIENGVVGRYKVFRYSTAAGRVEKAYDSASKLYEPRI